MAAQTTAAPTQGATGGLEAHLEEHAVIPVLTLGIVTNGSGKGSYDCKATGLGACSSLPDEDYDEKSSFVLGADLLFRVVPKFRLGFGFFWVPTPTIKYKVASSEEESGHQIDTVFVAEGMFPVADTVGIYVRGQVGVTMLIAGNDHQDQIDAVKAACKNGNGSGASCDTNEGPFFGPTFGLGVGVNVLVGDSVGLRAGLAGQFYSVPYIDSKVSGGGSSVDETVTATGNRGFLLIGLEL